MVKGRVSRDEIPVKKQTEDEDGGPYSLGKHFQWIFKEHVSEAGAHTQMIKSKGTGRNFTVDVSCISSIGSLNISNMTARRRAREPKRKKLCNSSGIKKHLSYFTARSRKRKKKPDLRQASSIWLKKMFIQGHGPTTAKEQH